MSGTQHLMCNAHHPVAVPGVFCCWIMGRGFLCMQGLSPLSTCIHWWWWEWSVHMVQGWYGYGIIYQFHVVFVEMKNIGDEMILTQQSRYCWSLNRMASGFGGLFVMLILTSIVHLCTCNLNCGCHPCKINMHFYM